MTTDTERAAQLLREHRESIDRLDAILVYTLAERFKQTQARAVEDGCNKKLVAFKVLKDGSDFRTA